MNRPRSRRGSLARNIVVLTTVVAALAAALTGLIAWQTAEHGAERRERDQLTRQATVLSRLPALSEALFTGAQVLAGPNSVQLAVIAPDGTVSGTATPAVDMASKSDLLAGEPVSANSVLGGQDVLLVGQPGVRGGAIVLTEPYTVVTQNTNQIRRNVIAPLIVGMLGAALAGRSWPAASPARSRRPRRSRTGSPTANAAYRPRSTAHGRPRTSGAPSTSWTKRWRTARTGSGSSCSPSPTTCAPR